MKRITGDGLSINVNHDYGEANREKTRPVLFFKGLVRMGKPENKVEDKVKRFSIQTIYARIDTYMQHGTRSRKTAALFEHLEKTTDLSQAPASTRYHGNYAGGLIDHTITVVDLAAKLYATFINAGKDYFPKFTLDSLVFCALVHDIGKVNMYLPTVYEDGPPFIYNSALSPDMPHELWSIYQIARFDVPCTAEELHAIMYHAGPYNSEMVNETDLQIILHSADNLAAKVLNI